MNAVNNTARQVCTFTVADLYFGIDVRQVQEVIRHQEMTPVPLAPQRVGGLINLRGQIVTALDLRRQLGLKPREADRLPMNVVVRDGDGAVSLLVDSIGDVLEVSEDLFEAPPATVRSNVRNLTLGAYKLPEKLLLLLDTERTLSVDETHEGAESRRAV